MPKITFPDPNELYTLIMIDPDGVDREGNMPYLHWWISNANAYSVDEWVKYTPPRPPRGTHRYLFYLFEQYGEISMSPLVEFPNTRENFDLSRWTRMFGLKLNENRLKGFSLEA